MRASRCRIPFAFVVFSLLCFASLQGQAQDIPREQLAATLASGGHVIVMRHANSPRELPDANTVNADNVSGERQLDDSGRRDALAMGEALRRLGIPVSEVLSSPTYRAMETVRLLGFTATPVEQLGNEGMRAAGEAWSAWLQAEVARAVSGGNRLLVTHGPNLSAAFPEYSRNMGEGEAFIFAPGGSQGPRLVHRIRIEDWTGL